LWLKKGAGKVKPDHGKRISGIIYQPAGGGEMRVFVGTEMEMVQNQGKKTGAAIFRPPPSPCLRVRSD